MTVLDAYAVIAFLRDERAADEVEAILRMPTVLSVVNAAEVVDQMVRVFGRDADDVHADLELLANAGMELLPVDGATAMSAGRLRATYYHRQSCAISLADCVAAATAIERRMPLATADPALATVVRAEESEIRALPDTSGTRP